NLGTRPRVVCLCRFGRSAALQILAIATAIAAVCALQPFPNDRAYLPLDVFRDSLASWPRLPGPTPSRRAPWPVLPTASRVVASPIHGWPPPLQTTAACNARRCTACRCLWGAEAAGRFRTPPEAEVSGGRPQRPGRRVLPAPGWPAWAVPLWAPSFPHSWQPHAFSPPALPAGYRRYSRRFPAGKRQGTPGGAPVQAGCRPRR